MTSDQTIALFASLGACFSAIATFLTVRQIAKQREASYRPELALSRVYVECTKDPLASGTIPTLWSPKGGSGNNDSPKWFSLPLQNIGLGTAKTVTVSWEFPFENVTKQVNELAQKTLSAAYFTFENDTLSLDSENLGKCTSMWRNQMHETLDYVLPAAVHTEPVMLKLPHAYTKIVSALIYFAAKDKDRKSFPEIPTLIANIEFYDIGEVKHSAKYGIQFQLGMFGGNGEFIHGQMESRKFA